MEKSINSRFYFDYNATSPPSIKVVNFVKAGDFLFGNPSSLHQTGKKALKYINETTVYLFKTFNLDPLLFDLIYHSGASEGINTFFKGISNRFFKEKKTASFFFSTVDHSAVIELKNDLELFGHKVFFFKVDRQGFFNKEELIVLMKNEKENGQEVILNYTTINNETGVIWPLEWASQIQQETDAFIHVDAVQLVGKSFHWNKLSNDLDSYTFSGHKFGSLKGVGFSFTKKKVHFSPLITGGGQQDGLRAGTLNALGIYSLKLALMDIEENFLPDELFTAKDLIEKNLIKLLGEKGEVVGKDNLRNLNTVFFLFQKKKAQTLSMNFDLLGIDVSTGSACSSGLVKENRILLEMGFSKEEALSGLRFSFSPLMKIPEAIIYSSKIEEVLSRV